MRPKFGLQQFNMEYEHTFLFRHSGQSDMTYYPLHYSDVTLVYLVVLQVINYSLTFKVLKFCVYHIHTFSSTVRLKTDIIILCLFSYIHCKEQNYVSSVSSIIAAILYYTCYIDFVLRLQDLMMENVKNVGGIYCKYFI